MSKVKCFFLRKVDVDMDCKLLKTARPALDLQYETFQTLLPLTLRLVKRDYNVDILSLAYCIN